MPDVSDISSEIDDHGYADASDTRKLAVINQAYWDVCAREPWPFLESTVSLTFDGSASAPTNLPSDFHAAGAMQVNALGGAPIRHERYENYLRGHVANTSTGTPRIFYFDKGGDLNFWPIPTSDIQVQMQYIATPVALTLVNVEADILIPKQFQRATLVNGAVYRLGAMEDDTDIAAWFKQEYEASIAQMQDWLWRRQYVNPDIIRPVDSDDLNGGAENTLGFWYGG